MSIITVVVAATAVLSGLTVAEHHQHHHHQHNKNPVFHARAEAPRLTREYAELTNNTEVFFEWHDSRLQQHLWKAATSSGPASGAGRPAERRTLSSRDNSKLGKRAPRPPQPRPVGAPLARGNCAGCAGFNADQDQDILSWDWQYMQTQMITSRKNRLKNRCIFYTGLPPDEKRRLHAHQGGPPKPEPEGQSKEATVFACQQGLLSIWNLWPGKNDIDDNSFTDKDKPNFWEITEEDNWLYRLSKKNQGQYDGYDYMHYRGHYFSVMSDAMAHSCSGTVYVMAMNTDHSIYRGIWIKDEYKTLKGLHKLHPSDPNRVTRLIMVHTLNPAGEQYNLLFDDDKDYPLPGSRITKRDPDYLHFLDFELEDDHEAVTANMTEDMKERAALRRRFLEKRDSCTANIEYEAADGGDWFGRGY